MDVHAQIVDRLRNAVDRDQTGRIDPGRKDVLAGENHDLSEQSESRLRLQGGFMKRLGVVWPGMLLQGCCEPCSCLESRHIRRGDT